MPLLSIYIVKMMFCSAVLFLYYRLFLRNKIFHAYNRYFLLFTVVVSLVLPCIDLGAGQSVQASEVGLIKILQVVNSDQYMEAIVMADQSVGLSQAQIIVGMMVLFSAFLAFLFVKSLIGIYRLKKSSRSQWLSGIQLLHSQDSRTPFSFFKNIFWNESISLQSDTGKRIFKHELAHVQERHSHDRIFLQIILIFFWFNPVFWLIRNELKLIHEFIADRKAIEDGDTADFAGMILAGAYPKTAFQITSPFFYSPIKRRIAMIAKNKNSKAGYISRALVLPLVVLVVAAFSFKQNSNTASRALQEKIVVVLNAGHGGTDNGATSQFGKTEKEINLELVKKIQALNQDKNIHLILTREEDMTQNPREIALFTQKSKADLFISVHVNLQNPKSTKELSGMEVFVSKDDYANSAGSKLFASALIGIFKENYGLQVADLPMQRQVGIWVLQEAKCPSVLIEAGYINTQTDYNYINSAEGQNVFANNILKAITQFAQNQKELKHAARETVESSAKANPDGIAAPPPPAAPKAPAIKPKSAPPAPPAPPTPPVPATIPAPPAPPQAVMKTETFILTDETIELRSDSIFFSDNKSENILDLDALYVLDGKIISKKDIKKLEGVNFKNIHVLKGKAAEDKWGEQGKKGVIELTLNTN